MKLGSKLVARWGCRRSSDRCRVFSFLCCCGLVFSLLRQGESSEFTFSNHSVGKQSGIFGDKVTNLLSLGQPNDGLVVAEQPKSNNKYSQNLARCRRAPLKLVLYLDRKTRGTVQYQVHNTVQCRPD